MISEQLLFILIIAVLKNNFPEIYLAISNIIQVLTIFILLIFIFGIILYKIKIINNIVDNYIINLIDAFINFENYMNN
jgi:hypothetical protein